MKAEIMKWLDEFFYNQYVIKKDHIAGNFYKITHNCPETVLDSYMHICDMIDSEYCTFCKVLEGSEI